MKASFRLSGLRKVVLALLVGIFALGTWQTVSAKDNQNGNFLTSVFGSLSNLFVENKTQNLSAQNNQVFDDLVIGTCDTAGPIEVESTGGVLTPTAYTTLGAAFTAINAGTHTGTINVEVCGSTTETAPAVLNSTGAGSASYTALSIRPLADGLTISGATATGRGLIELNGADNVTIDGDNPNTAGINRNLTITNTAANTITYTSAVRVALSTLVTSANGNTVRNTIINGSATGRNVTGTTSTTGSENTTYGILVGGGASTAAVTTAPSAIASVSTTIASGQTATNFTVDNNAINAVARGLAVQGAATTVATGLSITNNTIGAAASGNTTTVYSMGMTLQGFASARVAGNTVRNIESFLSASVRAIDFGSVTAVGTGAIVERNIINRVFARSTTTYGAYGIQVALSTTSNSVIRNNFITDIGHDISGGGAFPDTTFAPFGIRLSSGTNFSVYHNSVNLTGALPGTATATNLGSIAFAITATSVTNTDVRNNIFANTQSGGVAPIAYASIFLPSGATSTMNLTLNNNDYFSGTGTGQGIAQVGGTAGTLYTAANFNAGATTPATNLRAYTSTLSTAGTNDNATKVVDPLFVSATDLHISSGSPMVNSGAAVGVTNDIDRENRVNTPDIGADETDGVLPPANDIAASAIVTPASGAGFFTGATTTPQATFTNVGLNAQANVSVQFTITGPGGYSYSNTQIIPAISADQALTVTFATTPAFTTPGTYTSTATVVTADDNSANNSVNATFSVVQTISGGSVNVGTGEAYSSLTNAGGIFAAINGGTVTSNITVNITSNLSGETGTIALNEIAGGFTVTIKPSGGARTITGVSSSTTGLLGFNGTDNVTIDGSLSGGTDRSLTITSTNAGATGGGIYFASGTNGAQNNVIKNVNVVGNGSTTGMLLGIAIAGNTFGGAGADNDNNRIENNDVRGAYYGIASLGASSANKDAGLVITKNVMPSTGTAGIGRLGIYIISADGAQITENNIASVFNPGSVDTIGIGAGTQGISTTPLTAGTITNANISRNYVGVVSNNATFSSAGIVLASDTSGTNNVVNNMITGVIGDATSGDLVAGIYVNPLAGATQNVYNNSVSMSGSRGAVASMFPSYALAIASDQPVNVVNNILVNSQTRTGTGTGGESYAIGFDGPAANVNLLSNYNDLFVSGAIGVVGITGDLTTAAQAGTAGTGTNQATLAAWQTATTEDANSISSDPLFTSATDLHLLTGSPAINVGTTSVGVTTDYDGQTRDATPDIGADEFVVLVPGTLAFSSATYSIGEAGGTVTLTVNRTGGTDGAVAVNYTLGGGTATGGAACGGTVDYVNTGGTVNFANGEASKTFNVTICNDAVLESSETFDATLAGATGGATIGTPNPATVTIIDDEVAVPGTLAFSSATYTVGEGGGSVTLTVNRSGGTDGAVSATYALSGGTATGGAACGAGIDYVNAGGTVSFANGEASKTFNVAICEDTIFEGNETFNATLSGATGGATIGTPNPATVTITDNETQPTVQFSAATYSTTETLSLGSPGATITVTLSGASQSSATVNYATGGGTATGGATCAAGVDYISASGTLTFNAGVTSQTFFVTTCSDTTFEGDETVNLTLSSPVGATLGSPAAAVLTIVENDPMPPTGTVTVTATAGTASASYNTVTEAVTAINAGTHQGAITVSVNANTTEPAAVVLNGSGAGAASYTAITIRPGADSVTVSGASATGRGLIELNGADNVTIDGDNPATTGTNRNLTLQNTAANTVTFTSVIRVAVAATVVNSADNNAFKNLNILGSATGRNIATGTSTTGTENTTFGIFAGPGASTTDGTVAPAAVASVLTSVAAGATATNLVVSNNNIRTAARGVSMNGAATTVFPGLQINGNSIGNPTLGDVDQVYAIGITAQGSADAIIRENTVWVEGAVASSAAGQAINVGVNSTAINGATIERNKINRVQNNNPSSWSAMGINLGGGLNHVVQNNFVSGVINNQTAGTGAFGSTFGAYGVRIAAGTGHKVYHNSVNLYGVMPGVTSTNLTAAFIMTATTQTGVDVRNNIFANQITGGNPTGTRNVSVALPTGATVTMNLTLNNNAYYSSGDANSRLAQVGTTFGTGEYTVGNFDPTSTTPATNFRAYTSPLSAAGTNDNSSFASGAAAPFTSNSDLHIPAGTATRLESGGAAVGVTNDIDLETRNATTPDIGADEFAGNPAPANDIAAAAFITPTSGSTLPVGQTFTPQASFLNNGTATQTNVTVRYRITNSSNVVIYNQTATIATIAPLQVVTASFPTTSLPAGGAYTIQANAELAGDANTANDSISGTLNAVAPIGGTINVGTGETYTSLTNAGGIFQALNTAGISGNTTINITSDLTAETGAVVLNQLAEVGAGGYTVTFKPSGAARVISGTAPANTGLITLNGADRIVFDGSLSGGTDRSLTITNNQTGTSTVIWIRTPNSSNGANNNTIKNCIINGATGATATTTAGILTGSSVTIGGDAEAASNNNTIQNNFIYRVQNSLYLRGGAVAANFDQNWMVADNEMGSTASTADKNLFRGMLIGNSANFTITRNLIHGVQSSATTTAAMSGIQLGLLLSNGTVTRNNITDIKNISASGTGAYGISVIATSTASNVTIANNFVSDVSTTGLATITSNGFGMSFNSTTGGSGYNVYYNSVNMNTNQTTGTTSAAVFVNSTFATAGAIDLRNNILANTQTTGTRYAVYSTAAATVFSAINYNDYFAQNVGFIGGSARPTLADWQTATGQDANSLAVDPLFVSATNLHLQAGSPVLNLGTPIATVTDDIDGDTRSATTPDIGADEVASVAVPGSLQFSSATYSIGEAGGTQTVTVTRTGGSDGSVSVQYATGGGTATGGAACGGSVDYVSASGTLTFAAGVTSQTFNVTICNDVAVEGNETFNYTLSSATGGATIGSPSTAVQTIVDDDGSTVAYSIAINDAKVIEADSGVTNAVFTVTVTSTGSGTFPVTVQYATANGTAIAGVDYSATSGTLTFNAVGTQTITVPVIGDTVKEANETFFVNLSNASANATIADGQGVGIIVDRDRAYVADYDRDYIADFSVYRPSNSTFYVSKSTKGFPLFQTFDFTGVSVPGDYDGDGKTDYALWNPSTSNWSVLRSSDMTTSVVSWGLSTDKPVQGDYNGDGKTDYAVYRPSAGLWYILPNSNDAPYAIQFGISTDRPVQADYDGDFKTDLAVYRDGVWYVFNSSNGSVTTTTWGLPADKPVVGDFDGDGKNDITVFRNGIWYVRRTLTNDIVFVAWGTTNDIPVVADYDADGISDYAVFRESDSTWYVLKSSGAAPVGFIWGLTGDKPTPAAYLPQ